MQVDFIEYPGLDDAPDILSPPFFDEMTIDALTAFSQSNQVRSASKNR